MPKIFLRYTAELAIWHAESRAAGDDEPTMVDVTDKAAIAKFPLDVHILIRDNWTGKCIAQRVAHGDPGLAGAVLHRGRARQPAGRRPRRGRVLDGGRRSGRAASLRPQP